jgi:hypothetical protein
LIREFLFTGQDPFLFEATFSLLNCHLMNALSIQSKSTLLRIDCQGATGAYQRPIEYTEVKRQSQVPLKKNGKNLERRPLAWRAPSSAPVSGAPISGGFISIDACSFFNLTEECQ